jgi:hypothetical protein
VCKKAEIGEWNHTRKSFGLDKEHGLHTMATFESSTKIIECRRLKDSGMPLRW